MKAIVYKKYGPPDVLQLNEVEKPKPKDNEVLIKVNAATVATGDVNARGFIFVPPGFRLLARLMFGLIKPRKPILGFEFSGIIEEVGRDVKLFKKGDQVFGIDGNGMGAYAEYKCLSEEGCIAIKPAELTFEEAASIPNGALTALYFLRDKGEIRNGQKVLINGASGSVGAAAVQLAGHFGAEVTGVCSTANLDLIRSLGADKVIDYTKEDFTKSGEYYDIMLDTVGNISISRFLRSLTPEGRLLLVTAGLPQLFQMLWTSIVSRKKVIGGGGMASERKENLVFLKELVEKRHLKPVIDRHYPLEEIAEAHRYVDKGRKKGNVVIIVEHSDKPG